MATDIGSIYARLLLDRSGFTRGLADAKAEAAAFGDVVVPVEADTARFDASTAEVYAAKKVMASPVDTTVSAETAPFDLGAAQVEAMKAAIARPVSIPVELDPSKLNLFTHLVSGGESPSDVAKYLGFSKQELSSALGSIAMQAAEDAKAQFAEAGQYAAGQMLAGWMEAAQRQIGPGSAIESGMYRLLTGGADPYMSTGGAIPAGPSDPGWRFWSPAMPPLGEIGPGYGTDMVHVPGQGSSWTPPMLPPAWEPLQLLSQNPESATWAAYQKMYQAYEGTSGSTLWEGVPDAIPTTSSDAGGPGAFASILGFLSGRFGAKGENGKSSLLAPIAAAGGGGALLSSLLWGGGSGGVPIPFLGALGAGMAGFGSLASFAGLGPEHLLMTGVGLAGNAVGAGLGGALLGAGALGVTAVGMGTDMAGIGQAAGDIKSVYAAQNQLNQAIAVYGKNSAQAAQAQAQLNYTLAGFSPVARSAVLSASNTAQQFKAMFDQLTGPAEAIGAQIIQQAMMVGEKFLPTIGKFAAQNMGIIRSSLQPLFGWLQGPGLSAFTELEQVFQQHLPTAMHAFDQGIELVIRTLGYLAPQTGGLIATIDRLVTRFNNGGWTQWEVGIQKLIGDFRQWEALIKILVADIYQLFHNDAGTASGIVGSLTQMLTKLHEWETSTQGAASLHNIFETHKQEVLELLQLLPPLVSGFGNIYMTVAPALTRAMTGVLQVIVPVLDALSKNPVGAWVLGLTLLSAKLGLLTPLLGVVNKALGALFVGEGKTALDGIVAGFTRLAGLAWGGLVSGVRLAAAAFSTLDLSMAALSTVGIVAVAAGVVLLTQHFGLLPGLIIAGAAAVGVLTVAMWALDAVPIVALIVGIGLAVAGLIAAIIELATHWSTVWGEIKSVAAAVWSWLSGAAAATWSAITSAARTSWSALEGAWSSTWTAIRGAASSAWDWITSTASATWAALTGAAHTAWDGLSSAWNAMWSAMRTVITTVGNVITGVVRAVSAGIASIGAPLAALAALWAAQWHAIGDVVGAVAGGIETAINGIVSAVHAAESAISALQSAYNSVTSSGPSIGGVSLNPLHYLPHLAAGGLVTQPTVALIGEAGPELVIPMSLLNGPAPAPLPNMTVRSGSVPAATGFTFNGGPVTVNLSGVGAADVPTIRQSIDQVLQEHDEELMRVVDQLVGSK